MKGNLRILVTGADGFIGSLVCRELQKSGHQIIEFRGNITNSKDLSQQINDGSQFDRILHLAGLSAVGECEKSPEVAFQVNSVGTFLLVDLIKKHCPTVPLIFASSAQVYAAIGKGAGTITEDSEIDPSANTYARTKWIAEEYIKARLGNSNCSYTILRIFNHSHKTQRPDFFMPSIYAQIQQAASNAGTGTGVGLGTDIGARTGFAKLTVGNVDVYRDIGAIQDLVSAIAIVVVNSESKQKIYNVCSGKPKSLRALIELISRHLGVKVEITIDPERIRSDEAKTIMGSCKLLESETNWRPLHGINEETLTKSFFAEFY